MFKKVFIAYFLSLFGVRDSFSNPMFERKTTGQLGVKTLGIIGNVLLVKVVETREVKAVKKGSILLGKYTVVEVFKDKTFTIQDEYRRLVKVSREAFQVDPKGSPNSRQATVQERTSFQEDGFSSRKKGDSLEVRMDSRYRDKLIKKDLAKVLMQAAAEPVIEEGKMIGFGIYEIDPGSIFEKALLQDGDIITSIDGVALDSIGGTVSLLNQLKNRKSVKFELLRNGQKVKAEISE